MNIDDIDRILNNLKTKVSIVSEEDEEMLLNYINYLKSNNERQADMLQEIFNIVYNDDSYKKQVKQTRDILLCKGE